MAETSAIEWTDSTFNPWIGCTKISPACDHCYAEALMDKRHHRVTWGGERSRTSASNWHQPRVWQKQAAEFFQMHGRRRRVFCSSLADVFDNQVPDEWRTDLWALIAVTPDLDWQLLTKRPQNIGKMLPTYWDAIKGHVWLGTTVEDQKRADLNIPHLLQHDAAVRFVSIEPLLAAVDLTRVCLVPKVPGSARSGVHLNALSGRFYESGVSYFVRWNDDGTPAHGAQIAKIDWVIAGGESGPGARPSPPDWFRSIRDHCARAGVPFLFKQWGEYAPYRGEGGVAGFWLDPDGHVYQSPTQWPPGADERRSYTTRYGRWRTGRSLDGITHDGFPETAP